MAQHRLTALALAGVLALGVSGCGDDTPPETAPSTTPASASPSATASGPVAPVLPELAKRQDAVGAKAFVKYWFAAVTYAMKTGDTDPFMEVSAKECKTCKNLDVAISDAYQADGRITGGGWVLIGLDPDPRLEPPLFRFAARVLQRTQTVHGTSGEVIRRERKQEALFFVGVRSVDGGFELLGLERIDD